MCDECQMIISKKMRLNFIFKLVFIISALKIVTTSNEAESLEWKTDGGISNAVCVGENLTYQSTPMYKYCLGMPVSNVSLLPDERSGYYKEMLDRYTNCTHVIGNLELLWIQEPDVDLSFLERIQFVSGYIMLKHVHIKSLNLPRLQSVYGGQLYKEGFHDRRFALLIIHSTINHMQTPALEHIATGYVGILHTAYLCYPQMIQKGGPMDSRLIVHNSTTRNCGCNNNNAQVRCNETCGEKNCFGPDPEQCCHFSCTTGCTGSESSDCFGCGIAPIRCPYERENIDGHCRGPCNGGICPKTCLGMHREVTSKNVKRFKNCTSVIGSIVITNKTFDGYISVEPAKKVRPLLPDELKVFKTVNEITGSLWVEGYHKDFISLSYFQNLKIIRGLRDSKVIAGQQTNNISLYVFRTSLHTLQLLSLESIEEGSAFIKENHNLCYTGLWMMYSMYRDKYQRIQDSVRKNRDNCHEDQKLCHPECVPKMGCWGEGAELCISCEHFKYNNTCVPNCHDIENVYEEATHKRCQPCHQQCKSGCRGPSSSDCLTCKNARDENVCVKQCPSNKYNDGGICKRCHPSCELGCRGPADQVDSDGCITCPKTVPSVSSDGGASVSQRCLKMSDPCPIGFYPQLQEFKLEPFPVSLMETCKPCHNECSDQECKQYRGLYDGGCREFHTPKNESICGGSSSSIDCISPTSSGTKYFSTNKKELSNDADQPTDAIPGNDGTRVGLASVNTDHPSSPNEEESKGLIHHSADSGKFVEGIESTNSIFMGSCIVFTLVGVACLYKCNYLHVDDRQPRYTTQRVFAK